MLIYNLLEYSDNYSMTSGSLWNYYRDDINDDENEIDDNAEKIYNNKKSKTKKVGATQDNANRLNAKVFVPWKYLSNSWRSLDLPLINCELELDLRWARSCAPFTKCITKTDGRTTDYGKNLNLVMPMYNLIEYCSNYSETTGSL